MKKILSLILMALLLVSVVGCGKDTKPLDNNPGKDVDRKPATTNNWTEFYNLQSELNSNASDAIGDATEDNDSTKYIWAPLTALNGSVDLAFTASFFLGSETGVKAAFAIFGFTDINYNESGNKAILSAKNQEGEAESFELEYDKSSQTAQLIIKKNDTIESIQSVYAKGNNFAKTYWGGTEGNYVELLYNDETGDLKMSWDKREQNSARSVFKNPNLAQESDFGASAAEFIAINDGVITGH